VVLGGMSGLAHLEENLGAVNAPDLSDHEMARIQAIARDE
jgi:aryl-alcohol dehydrogenase-like predicted oxidoreductase